MEHEYIIRADPYNNYDHWYVEAGKVLDLKHSIVNEQRNRHTHKNIEKTNRGQEQRFRMEDDIEKAGYENETDVLDVLVHKSVSLLVLKSHSEWNYFDFIRFES